MTRTVAAPDAAQATPSPAFPAEAVTTGPPPACVSAASAPRTLKEPVGCCVSTFSHTRPPSAGEGTSGVGASR